MKIFQEENKIMNKAELIAAVAENAELTKKDAEKALSLVNTSLDFFNDCILHQDNYIDTF